MVRTPEEQDAYDKIVAAYDAILTLGGGLRGNQGELVQAVHVMQHFVSMHVLHRLDPEFFSDWYSKD